MAFAKMKEVYHLKKKNFTLTPKADWVCYFGRGEIEKLLTELVGKAFTADVPPKAVVYGDWGSGKTQTLWHFINTVLAEQAQCLYITLNELPANTELLVFYRILMDKIPPGQLRKLLAQARNKYGNFQSLPSPEQETTNVLTVFERFLASATESVLERKAWSWIVGYPVSSPSEIGLPENSKQVTIDEALNILWYVGTLHLEFNNKFFVFCIDEAHRLKQIDVDSFPERTFIQAFRSLFLKDFPIGIIFCIGIGAEEDLPHMLIIGEVRERVGRYLGLTKMDKPEIRSLIKGVIRYARDGATWDSSQGKIKWNNTDESITNLVAQLKKKDKDIEEETFPFTSSAVELLVDYFSKPDYAEYQKPRRICDCLDFIASEPEAIKKEYIDKEIVEKSFMKYIVTARPPAEGETLE